MMDTQLTKAVTGEIVQANGDSHLVDLFIRSKRSEHTKTQYAHSLAVLADFIGGKAFSSIRLEDALGYHEWLKSKYDSAHSVKLHVSVAKALFAFGVKINYLRTNVFAVVKYDTPSEITHKRILTEAEVHKLIDKANAGRDKMLLTVVYVAGLRASEVCNLTWGDLLIDGILHVRHGKGQKDRFVTLPDSVVESLRSYQGDAASDERMFTSQRAGQIVPSTVHRIVKATAKAAGISEDASAHWLRHSHASHSLDRGASIVTVRDTLGHTNISTTNKYLHGKRNDSSALHLGFGK